MTPPSWRKRLPSYSSPRKRDSSSPRRTTKDKGVAIPYHPSDEEDPSSDEVLDQPCSKEVRELQPHLKDPKPNIWKPNALPFALNDDFGGCRVTRSCQAQLESLAKDEPLPTKQNLNERKMMLDQFNPQGLTLKAWWRDQDKIFSPTTDEAEDKDMIKELSSKKRRRIAQNPVKSDPELSDIHVASDREQASKENKGLMPTLTRAQQRKRTADKVEAQIRPIFELHFEGSTYRYRQSSPQYRAFEYLLEAIKGVTGAVKGTVKVLLPSSSDSRPQSPYYDDEFNHLYDHADTKSPHKRRAIASTRGPRSQPSTAQSFPVHKPVNRRLHGVGNSSENKAKSETEATWQASTLRTFGNLIPTNGASQFSSSPLSNSSRQCSGSGSFNRPSVSASLGRKRLRNGT